jgi:hypothetical protein
VSFHRGGFQAHRASAVFHRADRRPTFHRKGFTQMPKVKIGKLRELHAHLTSILNDCDAASASASDDKVGAGSITNTLNKTAQDSAIGTGMDITQMITNARASVSR